jgi:alkylated DNA repair dioxygenase AlkB
MTLFEQLIKENGEAILYKQFFDTNQADSYFEILNKNTKWKHEPIKIFGKYLLQPRLTAYYGERNYPYSGIIMRAQPWTPVLLEIKSKVEVITDVTFNAVLLNMYRDGNDSIGWHSDDERELAKGSVIASLSLGETRVFIFRRRDNHQVKIERNLANGDLLIMRGETQKFWQHHVPKTGKKIAPQLKPRINLTFRVIK